MGYSLETQWAVTRIVPSGPFRVSPVFFRGSLRFLRLFSKCLQKKYTSKNCLPCTVGYLRLNLWPHITTSDHIWPHLTLSDQVWLLIFSIFLNFFFLNKKTINFFFKNDMGCLTEKFCVLFFNKKSYLLTNKKFFNSFWI